MFEARRIRTLAPALGCLLFTACADDQESLIFLHVPAWPGPDTCSVDAGTDTYLLFGDMDLGFGTGYFMPGVLLNQLSSSDAESTASGVDDAEMQLQDVEVRLRTPRDPAIAEAVAAANPAFVEFKTTLPANSISPGERHGVLVEVITSQAAQVFADTIQANYGAVDFEIVADTVFNALRHGSSRRATGTISSRTYSFPIRTCFGCLLDCTACVEAGDCSGDLVGGVCGNAQDFAVVPAACTEE